MTVPEQPGQPGQPGPPPGRDEQPAPQYETYGGESFFEAPGATQQMPIPPASVAPNPRRRRTLWLVGGIVAVLVVGGGVTAIVATSGPSSASAAPAPASSGPSAGTTQGKHGKGAKGAKHKKAAGALAAGESELQGSVTSVDSGKVTITPTGLSPVTVNTSDSTKVSGTNASSLSDLKAGQQVTMVIKDGTATTIRIRSGS